MSSLAITDFLQVFQEIDEDGDELISRSDVEHALTRLGLAYDVKTIDKMMALDENGRGGISFEEFYHGYRNAVDQLLQESDYSSDEDDYKSTSKYHRRNYSTFSLDDEESSDYSDTADSEYQPPQMDADAPRIERPKIKILLPRDMLYRSTSVDKTPPKSESKQHAPKPKTKTNSIKRSHHRRSSSAISASSVLSLMIDDLRPLTALEYKKKLRSFKELFGTKKFEQVDAYFERFDLNETGSLFFEEYLELCKNAYPKLEPENLKSHAERMWKTLVKDNQDCITLVEFMSWYHENTKKGAEPIGDIAPEFTDLSNMCSPKQSSRSQRLSAVEKKLESMRAKCEHTEKQLSRSKKQCADLVSQLEGELRRKDIELEEAHAESEELSQTAEGYRQIINDMCAMKEEADKQIEQANRRFEKCMEELLEEQEVNRKLRDKRDEAMDQLDNYIATRPSLDGVASQKELNELREQVERSKKFEKECHKLRDRVRVLESSERSTQDLLNQLYKTLSILRQALCGGVEDGDFGFMFDNENDQGEANEDGEITDSQSSQTPAFVLHPGHKSSASLKKFKEYLEQDVFELTKLAHRKLKEKNAEQDYFYKTRRHGKKIKYNDLAAVKKGVHKSLNHSLKDMRNDAARRIMEQDIVRELQKSKEQLKHSNDLVQHLKDTRDELMAQREQEARTRAEWEERKLRELKEKESELEDLKEKTRRSRANTEQMQASIKKWENIYRRTQEKLMIPVTPMLDLCLTLSETFLGDYLNIPQRFEKMLKRLRAKDDTQILFADSVLRMHKSKPGNMQEICMIVTQKAVYHFRFRNSQCTRTYLLEKIAVISVNFVGQDVFVVHIPSEFDIVYQTSKRFEAVYVVIKSYEGAVNKTLNIDVCKRIPVKMENGATKTLSFRPHPSRSPFNMLEKLNIMQN